MTQHGCDVSDGGSREWEPHAEVWPAVTMAQWAGTRGELRTSTPRRSAAAFRGRRAPRRPIPPSVPHGQTERRDLRVQRQPRPQPQPPRGQQPQREASCAIWRDVSPCAPTNDAVCRRFLSISIFRGKCCDNTSHDTENHLYDARASSTAREHGHTGRQAHVESRYSRVDTTTTLSLSA